MLYLILKNAEHKLFCYIQVFLMKHKFPTKYFYIGEAIFFHIIKEGLSLHLSSL